MLLDDLLEVGAAELEYQVLRCLALLVFGVVDVKKSNYVLALPQFVEDLELSTHIFPRLGRSLYGDCLFMLSVICLKDIA